MAKHECPRCGFTTNYTQVFTNHLLRKIICQSKKTDTSLEELKNKMIPHSCENCEKRFTTINGLTKHLQKCKDKTKEVDNLKNQISRLENIIFSQENSNIKCYYNEIYDDLT